MRSLHTGQTWKREGTNTGKTASGNNHGDKMKPAATAASNTTQWPSPCSRMGFAVIGEAPQCRHVTRPTTWTRRGPAGRLSD
jgi:hypothetical protein